MNLRLKRLLDAMKYVCRMCCLLLNTFSHIVFYFIFYFAIRIIIYGGLQSRQELK